MPALVMNCLAPSITHSPSSSRARVRTLPASEPASGSVSPNAPSLRPARQLRQPLAASAPRAEQVDRLRAERRVRAHRDRHGGVHARELLDRDRVGERVAARAADSSGNGIPISPSSPSLAHDLVRERLRRGRAPPRPARPRPRRSRGRCGGSARGRARGRSPSRPPCYAAQLDQQPHAPARRRPWRAYGPAEVVAPRRRCRGAPTARRRRSGAGTAAAVIDVRLARSRPRSRCRA